MALQLLSIWELLLRSSIERQWMAQYLLILRVLAHSAENHGLVDQLGHSQLSCQKINKGGDP